jgi:hypothetical protein
MIIERDITLPEWVFLDGNSHLGDTLNERTLLQHIQSYTILEFFVLDDENPVVTNSEQKSKEFDFTNIFGEYEKHQLIVHFSLAGEIELAWIINRSIEFYKHFMDWEDTSLIIEETSKDN